MGTKVWKFGGSSVATAERIRAVAGRIAEARAAGDRLVVAVSAMGKSTDQLLKLASEVSPSLHRRELDMLLTSGERISMALLAMAVSDTGHPAQSLTGSQAGIVTTSDHNQARIVEVRPQRVRDALDAGQVVIVGGFQGVSVTKEVTTLGRGGSDTTAVALAAALGAECTIYSDVDGVYEADPRVVPEARRLDMVSHDFVLELGLRGAKVLAPEAVDAARRWGVTIRAESTFAPGTGTILVAGPEPGWGRAVAVTSDAMVMPVEITGPREAARSLLCDLEDRGLVVRDLEERESADELWIRCSLDPRNTTSAGEILDGARAEAERVGLRCVVDDDWRPVAVVAEGLAEAAPLRRRMCAALAEGGVPIRRLRASGLGTVVEVPKVTLDQAVRAVFGAVVR